MASKLQEATIRVLDEAQTSIAGHPKLLATVTSLYERTGGAATFFNTFFPVFSNVLLVYKRELAAERVVEFISKFVVSLSPEVEGI